MQSNISRIHLQKTRVTEGKEANVLVGCCIFILNSQHVFRHLPSVLQLMSSGKVVLYVSAENINISAKGEERNIHIYFSFTAGVEFCRC